MWPGANTGISDPQGTSCWAGTAEDMLTVNTFSGGAKVVLCAEASPPASGCCHKYGFKSYAAMRQWHGTYGFTSNDGCGIIFGTAFSGWVSGTYGLGQMIFDTNGNIQVVTAIPPGNAAGNTGVTQPSWPTSNGGTVDDGGGPSMGGITWTTCTVYHPPGQVAPDQTKYCGMAVASYLEYYNAYAAGEGPPYINAWVYDGSSTVVGSLPTAGLNSVNPLTGERTSTIITLENDYNANGAFNPPASYGTETVLNGNTVLDYLPAQDVHCLNGFSLPLVLKNNAPGSQTICTALEGPFGVLTGTTLNDFIIAWNTHVSYYNGDDTTGPYLPPVSDYTNYSQTLTFTGLLFPTVKETVTITIAATATGYNFILNYQQYLSLATVVLHNFQTVYTLSAANTTAAVNAEVVALSNEWSLNGPEPWRVDAWTSIMPLVQRREVQGNVSPVFFAPALVDDLTNPIVIGTSWHQRPWFDPDAYFWTFATGQNLNTAAATGLRLMMDGSIIGAPNPLGPGANGWFDFYFTDIRFCANDNVAGCATLPPFAAYTYQYGGTLADAEVSLSGVSGGAFSTFLPQNATHWTRNDMAHGIPRGAMIDVGSESYQVIPTGIPGTNGAITLIKSALVRLPTPSYDFARPCGSDRVLVDELSATYFNGTGPYTVQKALPDGGAYAALSTQHVLIWGTSAPDNDGIWTGVTQSGFTITLPAKNPGVNFWPLPGDYYHPFSGLYGDGMIGIVRFPSAPGLCGRQQAVFAANGGGTMITFAQAQTNLRSGDSIDLSDVLMNLITGGLTVTRVSDTQFTITAAYASIAHAVWVTSHGAAAWYWNDASQKMEFRYGGWLDFGNYVISGSGLAFVPGRYATWPGGAAVGKGTIVVDYNGNYQTAQNAGTTGTYSGPTFQPPWATVLGNMTSDGGVNWLLTTLGFGGCNDSCIKFTPCEPQVVSFTPGTDFEASWVNAWFSLGNLPAFVADGVFGSRAVANVDFGVTDLLYQAPQCPAGNTCAADTGTCPADMGNNVYSPPVPLMEARCGTVPGAAPYGGGPSRNQASPALPVDAVNGPLVWPAMAQPGSPGVVGSYYTIVDEAWVQYLNEIQHGGQCGRWPGTYVAWLPGLGNGN